MFLPNVRPGVDFRWRCDIPQEERQWVIGDNHRLQQVFTNVITNALKHTTSGSVTLLVGWEDTYLASSENGSEETCQTDSDATDFSRHGNFSSVDASGTVKTSQDIDIKRRVTGTAPPVAVVAEAKKSIMKKPSTIVTESISVAPRIRFECADTGPGILNAHQTQLFKKFVQRGGAPGTGLGLAIAKHLVVELMGGEIYFVSDPTVKPGSSCIVLLPLPLCHAPEKKKTKKHRPGLSAKAESKKTAEEAMQEELSILIVDDIKMNRMMLKRRFQKGIAPNATVSEAATGEEALEIIKSKSFDIIICDQYMEDAGGVLLGTNTIVAMRRMGIQSLIIGCSGNDIEKDFLEAGLTTVGRNRCRVMTRSSDK